MKSFLIYIIVILVWTALYFGCSGIEQSHTYNPLTNSWVKTEVLRKNNNVWQIRHENGERLWIDVKP